MGRVSFHRFAEAELNDAAAHYEIQRSGLGARFLAAVDGCIDAIVQQPEASPIILGSLRRRLVSRFPLLSNIPDRTLRGTGFGHNESQTGATLLCRRLMTFLAHLTIRVPRHKRMPSIW